MMCVLEVANRDHLARAIRASRQLAEVKKFLRVLKGVATVRLPNGVRCDVELHWYEAHGIGKRDLKIKRYLDEA